MANNSTIIKKTEDNLKRLGFKSNENISIININDKKSLFFGNINKYNEVYVTGFNHFDTSKGSIHYYENLKQLGHKSDLEKRIFNDLKLKKNIILI